MVNPAIAPDRYGWRQRRSWPAGQSQARFPLLVACRTQAPAGNPHPAASRVPKWHDGGRDQPQTARAVPRLSVSSTKALASSMPQTKSSNRSATRASDLIAAGKRRLRCGPMGEERRVRAPQMRLDPLQEQTKKQVLPGFPVAQLHPSLPSESRSIARGTAAHRLPRISGKRLGHGQAFDPGKVSGDAAAAHGRRQHGTQIASHLADQRVHIWRQDDTIPTS